MIAIVASVDVRNAIIGEYLVEIPGRGGNAGIFCTRIQADGFQFLQIQNVLMKVEGEYTA
jgi:hypothetical protein